ncbi:cell wall-binding repeat-containing protein [Clostridioides sp. ES-S-0006-03]|uniref:cell wall-binding repeat-containing protein n=1 Tax=Clostridioides sp. ES-S-0006-03 TaxID=2770775 RepID=UPI001D0C7BAF|nr:cell wall-binding repeat-containing protein [Clostridioides sp. ES-S-0006-03]
MKVDKRILSIGLTVSLIMAGSININALSSIEKIQGKDRYDTAAKIAQKQTYENIVLVNTDNTLADGLSASGLAGAVKAPILLSQKNSLPSDTENMLKDVKKAYIIGTEDSIGKSVENKLKQKGIDVKRIGGNDRIETSYFIAKEIASMKSIDKVFITNAYTGEADAMSASSVASRDGVPIILTNGKDVPFVTKEGVRYYALGSEEIISNDLVKKTNAVRLAGEDRFETNKKVIKHFYSSAKEFYLSKGFQLVDAVAGSSIAKNAPIVLVDGSSDKSVLRSADKITALGGIDEKTLEQCLSASALDASAPTITVGNLNVYQGDKFDISKLNIVAKDSNDNDLTPELIGNINTDKVGKYKVTIKATDIGGKTTSVSVEINVLEYKTNDMNSTEFKRMVSSEMYSLVNSYREEKGKESLQVSKNLEGLSNSWSKYMADKGQFSHVIDGKNSVEAFSGYGLRSEENIAFVPLTTKSTYTTKDAREVANVIFTVWKKSDKYNENMLNSDFIYTGFGLYILSNGEVYATQEFLNK